MIHVCNQLHRVKILDTYKQRSTFSLQNEEMIVVGIAYCGVESTGRLYLAQRNSQQQCELFQYIKFHTTTISVRDKFTQRKIWKARQVHHHQLN